MKKACHSRGQGTATPNGVRLLLQNRGLLAKVGSQSSLLPKKPPKLVFALLSGKQKIKG